MRIIAWFVSMCFRRLLAVFISYYNGLDAVAPLHIDLRDNLSPVGIAATSPKPKFSLTHPQKNAVLFDRFMFGCDGHIDLQCPDIKQQRIQNKLRWPYLLYL